MNVVTRIWALKAIVLLQLAWLPGMASAAEAAQSQGQVSGEPRPDNDQLDELEEIVVTGLKKMRDPQFIVNWLRRLLGEYSYDGFVEVYVDGWPTRQAVRGAGKCIPFGEAPGVQCAMQITWPDLKFEDGTEVAGGVSTLVPAMTLYGMDANFLGIRYLQVDSRGTGDGGLGYLRGNTLTTTTPCMDLPGDCKRISRINAQSDGKSVRMDIDIERDALVVARYQFLLRRVAKYQQEAGDADATHDGESGP